MEFGKLHIELEASERKLFDFLLEVVEWHFKSTGERIQVRVAGGWVRDKLLKRNSNDIDVVVDKVRGVDFGNLILKFDEERRKDEGNEERILHSHLIQIRRQKAQCKLVSSCSLRIFEYAVDFLHLRARRHRDYKLDEAEVEEEERGKENRKEKEEREEEEEEEEGIMGTPESDTQSRDFTINALYYNINTGLIEDHLPNHQGLLDLFQNKVLRSVDLENPIAIFLDDPIRIIRAVRFSINLGFPISIELQDAVLQPINEKRLRRDLGTKVSRTRLEQETHKILVNPDPKKLILAFEHFNMLHITPALFTLPKRPNRPSPKPSTSVLPSSSSSSSSASESRSATFSTLPAENRYTWEEGHVLNRATVGLEVLKSVWVQRELILGKGEEKIYSWALGDHKHLSETKHLFLACFLSSLCHSFKYESSNDQWSPFMTPPLTKYHMRDEWRYSNQDCDAITLLTKGAFDFAALIRRSNQKFNRVETGMLLRELGPRWFDSFLILQQTLVVLQHHSLISPDETLLSSPSLLERFFVELKSSKLLGDPDEQGPSLAPWQLAPLFMGRRLRKDFDIKQPDMNTALHEVIKWQLAHPKGTHDQCSAWLKSWVKTLNQ